MTPLEASQAIKNFMDAAAIINTFEDSTEKAQAKALLGNAIIFAFVDHFPLQ